MRTHVRVVLSAAEARSAPPGDGLLVQAGEGRVSVEAEAPRPAEALARLDLWLASLRASAGSPEGPDA